MEDDSAPEEFDKLVLLMKEYTEKLRAICEERLDSRYRRVQSATLATAAIAGVTSLMFLLVQQFKIATEPTSMMLILMFPMFIVTIAAFLVSFRTSRFRYSYDAERVAATVERLIRLASQYNEHAQKKISNRFELDLRIAEAEGALSLYKKVFMVDIEWKKGD